MNHLLIDAYDEFKNKWALVTAGTPADHNSMTIGWGWIGYCWKKPVFV